MRDILVISWLLRLQIRVWYILSALKGLWLRWLCLSFLSLYLWACSLLLAVCSSQTLAVVLSCNMPSLVPSWIIINWWLWLISRGFSSIADHILRKYGSTLRNLLTVRLLNYFLILILKFTFEEVFRRIFLLSVCICCQTATYSLCKLLLFFLFSWLTNANGWARG